MFSVSGIMNSVACLTFKNITIMSKEKLGQEPAYPTDYSLYEGKIMDQQTGSETFKAIGISKRFYAACAATQGLCVGRATSEIKKGECADIAEMAFLIADELLKQENE